MKIVGNKHEQATVVNSEIYQEHQWRYMVVIFSSNLLLAVVYHLNISGI